MSEDIGIKKYEEEKAELFKLNETHHDQTWLRNRIEMSALAEGARREREKWSNNMQAVWDNLSMVRDFIEHQVVGAMSSQERCYNGTLEAQEIIKGIEKIMEKEYKKGYNKALDNA